MGEFIGYFNVRRFLIMIAPDRVAFSLFGLDVMWYGLLIGLGFFIATLICYFRAKEHDIQPDRKSVV